MLKAFNIVGIILSVIFMILSGYYIEEVSSARFSYLYNSFSNLSNYSSSRAGSLTMEMGVWSLFFFLLFLIIFLLSLIKIKTATSKVLSIIGLSFTGIFLLWNFVMLNSPSSMSFDEVGGGWLFYCLIILAFTIVGLVQSIRYSKRDKRQYVETVDDLLDR